MKSWLKGGLIGILVFFVLAGIMLILDMLYNGIGSGLIWEVLEEFYLTQTILGISSVLIIIIKWFILGAIIGWIIGKIKEKKNDKK